MASASPSSQSRAFLSIPPAEQTEIRLRIYHYLFEKEPGDDCFLSGPRFGPWREGPETQRPKVERSIDMQDLISMGRHPEILRVNHQVYFEAFPVFYSGLETVDPNKGTWRYKPLEGDFQAYHFGDYDQYETFDVVYDPPLMQGSRSPQKLARFTKVLLIAKFMIPSCPIGWRYDEENGELDYAAQQDLTDTLRASNMIEDFVELLARCSWVDHVDIDLGVVASWQRDQQTVEYDSPVEDLETPHWIGLRKIWHKGDIQVADILLAGGVLSPLQRLSNIRSWCIELTVEDLMEEPPCMHERMTLDLSNAVEQGK
ncbi:hypothetical protein HO133_001793 [Letharia lupina]|uniref:Uncharacterized protein n=1 Tax=Letharia lupina TaxID=560253 RepID=A0A8H6FB26_9LECA|nr:uncharacterized protein HO133_001793 [Letharia lupina]KAF6221825.1 hypothetical protein HO133_001793 [Letharia lupina]